MRIDNQGYIQFGMHKGCHVTSTAVTADYLQWCVDNVHLTAPEYEAIMQEIIDREVDVDARRREATRQKDEADTARRQKAQAAEEARRRHTSTPPPPAPKASTLVCPATLLRVIAAGRGQLARLCHPDAGGDPAEMVRVNNAADYLESVARGLQAKRA